MSFSSIRVIHDDCQPKLGKNNRLESIHIMRGIAAFAVMMAHFTAANDNFRPLMPRFSSLFNYGGTGVWMFFVISGFVIPFSMKTLNYQFPASISTFLIRRLIRLEPVYIVSLLLAIAVSYAASQAPGYRGDPFSLNLAGFILQVCYMPPWFNVPWINGVAWTLAIEFQYYILMLIIGPLLLSTSNYRVVFVFVFVIISSLLIRDVRAVFIYLPSFGIGFAAFLYYWKRINLPLFIVLITTLGIVIGFNVNLPNAIVSVASALLIFMPIQKSIPILSFLGTISYSLYLMHLPFGSRVINLTTRTPSLFLQLLGLTGAIAVSLGAAYALWWLVERPSMTLSRTIMRKSE